MGKGSREYHPLFEGGRRDEGRGSEGEQKEKVWTVEGALATGSGFRASVDG